MLDQFITEIAKQGLGFTLAVVAGFAIFFLYKENRQLSQDKVDLANKRVEDLKEAQHSYATLSDAATKVAENTYTIVQNLQQLLNNWKKT